MKRTTLFLASVALMASGTLAMAAAKSDTIKAAIADSGRPEADTKRDDLRKPAQMLAFAGIGPGKVVVDLLPGGGYFTRIFAKAVEPNGRVYAYFGAQYDKRLKDQGKDPDNQFADLKKTYKNLGVVHGPLPQFVTPEPVDVVWTSQNYHDMHNPGRNLDINAANKAIFAALKPGGLYIVLDHNAGPGVTFNAALHRIDPDLVKKEVLAAGFEFVGESKVLANPADPHDKTVFDPSIRHRTDQFILKFRRPKK